MTNYPLTCNTWGPEEYAAIEQIVRGGRFTMGPAVRDFESAFAAKMGVKHAVMVNSGSSANLIAVAALFYKKTRPLQRGDEVIVPAISWTTTYCPLQQYGLKLRFVDVDLETLNMDASKLEAALTPKTRAVLAVSVLGNPAPLDAIRAFCDRHDLYFIEDNCESMGATLNGKQCGTFGDLGTLSTFYSHQISTMEGGIVVTDDDELHELCVCLRAHGWTRDLPKDSVLYRPQGDEFFEAYRFILPGYNVRPTELNGALGLSQLKKLDQMIELRRKNAMTFRDRFARDERFILQRENGTSSWFSFTMILDPRRKPDRTRVFGALRDAGIEFRIITGGNFLRHDVIRYFDYDCAGEIVNARIAHDYGFFVGNYPADASDSIDRLEKALRGSI